MDLKHTTRSVNAPKYSHTTTPLTAKKPLVAGKSPFAAKDPKKRRQQMLFAIIAGYFIIFAILYLIGNPTARTFVELITGRNAATKFVYHSYKVSFDVTVSPELQSQITEKLGKIEYEGTKKYTFTNAEESDYQIGVHSGHITDNDDIRLLYASYLVPVGHIYWIKDGISKDDLTNKEVITSEKDKNFAAEMVEKAFGKKPTLRSSATPYSELNNNENLVGLIDIGELTKEYKLLTLDSNFFLDKAPEGGIPYGLYLSRSKAKDFSGAGAIEGNLESALPAKFNKEEVLKLNMTGVTAISRGLAIKTNAAKNGGYAADKIGSFLADADLTHTSNEVSFVDGCTPGNSMRFCSHPSYIEALEKSGIDIVELTGNHNNDYGAAANASTIEMYKAKGWDYFGGGLNSADAAKILYKELKGTKIAFLGYNPYGTNLGSTEIAGATRAGANSWSNEKVKNDIKTARENGAQVVIVDFQYQECYLYTTYGQTACYGVSAVPGQQRDFRFAIDNGADIVIGAQAHQPQTYELYNGKIIFYGLGNLFFDQVQWLGSRQGIVLTHYFYKGMHMTTKISTTIYDSDMRPYVTVGSEREKLLKSLKNARP